MMPATEKPKPLTIPQDEASADQGHASPTSPAGWPEKGRVTGSPAPLPVSSQISSPTPTPTPQSRSRSTGARKKTSSPKHGGRGQRNPAPVKAMKKRAKKLPRGGGGKDPTGKVACGPHGKGGDATRGMGAAEAAAVEEVAPGKEAEDNAGEEAGGSSAAAAARDQALELADAEAREENARMAREAKELAEEEECQRRWYDGFYWCCAEGPLNGPLKKRVGRADCCVPGTGRVDNDARMKHAKRNMRLQGRGGCGGGGGVERGAGRYGGAGGSPGHEQGGNRAASDGAVRPGFGSGKLRRLIEQRPALL